MRFKVLQKVNRYIITPGVAFAISKIGYELLTRYKIEKR